MASSSSSTSCGSNDLPEKPYQPGEGYSFPKRSFGKSKPVLCGCKSDWFAKWNFLHYNESMDAVFCHTCVMATKEKRTWNKGCVDPAFVSGCKLV